MKTIPEEILVNILSRLPAKSIGRSRCVSKQWHHLLSEFHFIKDHLNQTKQFTDSNQSLILFPDSSHTLYTASITDTTAVANDLGFIVSPDFWTEGIPSCDGLILIDENNTDKRLLVNPTTKESLELPVSPYALDPRASFTMYGLGYDHVSDDNKVVTISYYNTDNEYESDSTEMFVSVYSVRNNTWKESESSPYDHCVGHLVAGVNGSLHWLSSRTSDYSSVIVGFDLSEEKFHEIPAPSSIEGENFVLNRLLVIGGCLWLCPTSSSKETVIWVMKEYGVKKSWSKLSIVDEKVSEFYVCQGNEKLLWLRMKRRLVRN